MKRILAEELPEDLVCQSAPMKTRMTEEHEAHDCFVVELEEQACEVPQFDGLNVIAGLAGPPMDGQEFADGQEVPELEVLEPGAADVLEEPEGREPLLRIWRYPCALRFFLTLFCTIPPLWLGFLALAFALAFARRAWRISMPPIALRSITGRRSRRSSLAKHVCEGLRGSVVV